MKVLQINTQAKSNEPYFNGQLVENKALTKLLSFVDDSQKFHNAMTTNAEQIKNIKILNRDPDFRLQEIRNRNGDYYEFALLNEHYAPISDSVNRIAVNIDKNTGLPIEPLNGAEVANKIINGMNELATSITKDIKNWLLIK